MLERHDKPVISVDFDGVIHSCVTAWKGTSVIPDPPVEGAMAFLAAAVERFTVCIFSSRSESHIGRECMRRYLWEHMEAELGDKDAAERVMLQIQWPTDKPSAMVSLDDRAITFKGVFPSMDELSAFTPWNRPAKRPQTPPPLDVRKLGLPTHGYRAQQLDKLVVQKHDFPHRR